jgi:predicted dehydrogenase
MRIALIGAGRMGSHYAGSLARSGSATIQVVVDANPMRAEVLAASVSSRASTRLDDAFDADAAILATPAPTHLPIALMLLDAGVPLLVDNPLSNRLDEAMAIVRASGASGVPMTTGFLERFNPVVQKALRLMRETGPAVHVAGLRHSAPDPIAGTHVLFDLLIHDVDLALGLLDGEWTGDVAGGLWDGPTPGTCEVADCTLFTDAGAGATLSASRMGQRKMALIEVTTHHQQMELDLVRRTMTVFGNPQRDVDPGSDSRVATLVDIPTVRDGLDPLAKQLEHFLSLVRGEIDADAERGSLLAPHRVAALVRSRAFGESSPSMGETVSVA